MSQTSHWSPQEGGGPEEPGASPRPARLHQYRGPQAEYDHQELEHPARSNSREHRCQLAMVVDWLASTLLMTETTETTETRCRTAVTTEDTTAIYICPPKSQPNNYNDRICHNLKLETLQILLEKVHLS